MQNNARKEKQLALLETELERTLRQKAMMEFEDHFTFYPPVDGRVQGTWENEETGETLSQEEAQTRVDTQIGNYIEEMLPTLTQTIQDR